ncbi:MAG: radical SAM protein [Pyrodictiaceae archaeon]
MEHGVIKRKCHGCLRVALLYPGPYKAASASLAYQNLYYMINSLDYAVAERITYEGKGPPRSIESNASLDKFDIILASISFELDYYVLAKMLLESGIEPLRERRSRGPLIVVGGPVPSMNPAVALSLADIVAVGDAEPIVPRLLEAVFEEDLERIVCSEGILAPGCNSVNKAITKDLDKAFHSIVQFREPGSGEPWGEAYMVEASRGCKHMCRFCMEAYFSLPLRHRSLGKLKELIEKGVEANSVKRVAFYSLSFFDHPHADKLLDYVASLGLEASIGSLRADTLNKDRIEMLKLLGQKVVTIAPETLSLELCRSIGKCILEDKVEEISLEAWKRRMHVKLYLMVGLPGERDKDVEVTAAKIQRILNKAPHRRGAMRITVNPLIPKPWTPLQYATMINKEDYERRTRILKKTLSSYVADIDVLSYRLALVEAIIARGGSWLGRVIRRWALLGGGVGQFMRALREEKPGISIDELRRPPRDMEWLEMVKPGFPWKALKVSWLASTNSIV